MKKMLWVFMAVVFCGTLSGTAMLFAEDSAGSTATNLKEAVTADKQKIAAEKSEIKTNSQAAHSEEAELKSQIKAAKLAGDKEKVKALRAQLKGMHQKNVQEMHQDKKDLNVAKKKLKHDRKVAVRSRQ